LVLIEQLLVEGWPARFLGEGDL